MTRNAKMAMRPRRIWGWGIGVWALALSVFTAPAEIAASVSKMVPSTGGFGEKSCRQCHDDNALNDPAGRLTLEGVPDTYMLGGEYTITVTLARTGLTRAGFQLSAREDGFNMLSGADAGDLATMDDLVETMKAGPGQVTYAQHSQSGSKVPAPGVVKWQVLWTAPPEPNVPVAFHVAASASNDDGSPRGDYIYTAIAQIR